MENLPVLYDSRGQIIERAVNTDRTFFHATPSGRTVSTADIEARPYQFGAWIFACAWTIEKNISRLPLVLYYKSKPSELIYEHEVLNLLENPNPLMTLRTLISATVLNILLQAGTRTGSGSLGGQCFYVCTDKSGGKCNLHSGTVPVLVMPYNDLFVKPETDKDGQLIGWIYEIPGKPSSKETYATEEIIRISQFNPYNWLSGIANYQPAQIAMTQDMESDVFNSQLFKNNAIPSGILSTEAEITPDKKREMLSHWYETYGGGNAQRVAMLSRGLKYQHIGLSQVDMQYKDMKNFLQEQITAVYGLNKIALGKYEHINMATIIEGRKMLWQDTYLPLAELITEALNAQWIRYIDKNLRIKFDVSGIPALRADYTTRAQSAAVMVSQMFLAPAHAMRINEIPVSDEDIQKYPWLEENPVNLRFPSTGETTVQMEGLIKTKEIKPDREKFWYDYVARVLDPGEKSMQKDLIDFFLGQRNRMQDKVDNWLKTQHKAITRELNIDAKQFLLDLQDETDGLIKLYKPHVKKQMEITAAELDDELPGGLVAFKVKNEAVAAFVKKRARQLKGINKTTFKAVENKVIKAIKEGTDNLYTPQEMAKEIKKAIAEVGEYRKGHSKTIARTEIGTITTQTRFDAFKDEGIEKWEWVSAMDEKVREDHQLENGEVINVGDKFPHTDMRYPLDPMGDVSQIVNCRCVTVAAE